MFKTMNSYRDALSALTACFKLQMVTRGHASYFGDIQVRDGWLVGRVLEAASKEILSFRDPNTSTSNKSTLRGMHFLIGIF